jgi:hypothetical protein
MNSGTIIAVDLGRHKSVACVFDPRTGAHAFRELGSTPGALDRLLAAHLVPRDGTSATPEVRAEGPQAHT